MIIVYDKHADAVYIYFTNDLDAKASHTYPVDPDAGQIYIDIDDRGGIIGIEVLDASKKLPKHLLEEAIDIKEFSSKYKKPQTG
ncbi:MAG: DUF2283 domain-containing protein [Thermoleophilia bacterium]